MYCKRPSFDKLVQRSNVTCSIEHFHYDCVETFRKPECIFILNICVPLDTYWNILYDTYLILFSEYSSSALSYAKLFRSDLVFPRHSSALNCTYKIVMNTSVCSSSIDETWAISYGRHCQKRHQRNKVLEHKQNIISL